MPHQSEVLISLLASEQSFQNNDLCWQAFPFPPPPSSIFSIIPSPLPPRSIFSLVPISCVAKLSKSCSSVFLCSENPQKRLLRRLTNQGSVRVLPIAESDDPAFRKTLQVANQYMEKYTSKAGLEDTDKSKKKFTEAGAGRKLATLEVRQAAFEWFVDIRGSLKERLPKKLFKLKCEELHEFLLSVVFHFLLFNTILLFHPILLLTFCDSSTLYYYFTLSSIINFCRFVHPIPLFCPILLFGTSE